METVALEDIYINTILTFCENLAELGCPKDAEPDLWFRYLPHVEKVKVAQKMFEIEERNEKNYNNPDKSVE
jgi:hypothetical protein